MDFADQIRQLAKTFENKKEGLETEEATKQALILPLLQALGYNIFDTGEVNPEYNADIGTKKGEKVDYAIILDNKPVILVEAKCCGEDLKRHNSQIYRYFAPSKARFAVLTDGITYQFYSDIDETNVMDKYPYFTINITSSISDTEIEELRKFHKDNFNAIKIAKAAQRLKYVGKLKNYLTDQIVEPNNEFAKFFIKKIYDGSLTKKVIDKLKPVVVESFSEYINEVVREKYERALAPNPAPDEPVLENDGVDDGIITTNEEIESYQIVRAILRSKIPADQIGCKDYKSHFSILYEDHPWKWICRFRFQKKRKTVDLRDSDGGEIKLTIERLDDLFNLSSQLHESLGYVLKSSQSEDQKNN